MYEDMTQNYYPEIHKEYLIHDTPCMIHPFPCHIIYHHVRSADYSIAINITN